MMNASPQGPSSREVATAVLAAVLWSALGLAICFCLGAAAEGSPCRIHNSLPDGSVNVGSGTLVDVPADRSRGLVLSCAHLFTEGTGRVVVEFPGGKTHGALVIGVDRQADLAALEIANPEAEPSAISSSFEPGGNLRACGFGPSGEYRCVIGQAIGLSEASGQTSVRMTGAVRSGDSGGGVFDEQGRLVAVVWGESAGVTYASTGRPLATFLSRFLHGRREIVVAKPVVAAASCPNGLCPLVRGPALSAPPRQWPLPGGSASSSSPTLRGPVMGGVGGSTTTACSCGCDERLNAITSRVDQLAQAKQDRGEYALRSELAPLARSDDLAAFSNESRQRHDSLLGRFNGLPATLGGAGRAAGVLATTALGISGPMGWGIIAAGSLGGWILGRRMKRKARAAGSALGSRVMNSHNPKRNPPLAPKQEATAAAETSFHSDARSQHIVEIQQPIEREDGEARELLRLSQLEGRDPLQDAVAGRLALDRLDSLAESDADPRRAGWADQLRRELRERFNDIAPTKFQVKAESGER